MKARAGQRVVIQLSQMDLLKRTPVRDTIENKFKEHLKSCEDKESVVITNGKITKQAEGLSSPYFSVDYRYELEYDVEPKQDVEYRDCLHFMLCSTF